jgi:hypothetical protein
VFGVGFSKQSIMAIASFDLPMQSRINVCRFLLTCYLTIWMSLRLAIDPWDKYPLTVHLADIDQVADYALDLHNFHGGSDRRRICPVLVIDESQLLADGWDVADGDFVSEVVVVGIQQLQQFLSSV